MKKVFVVSALLAFFIAGSLSYADQKSASDILKEGLLGAGAGAVGGIASGGKGKDLWKGALAGAGVNVVGGALLDSITGEKVGSVKEVESLNSQDAYAKGYSDGFTNGFKQGYMEGYKEGLKENVRGQ